MIPEVINRRNRKIRHDRSFSFDTDDRAIPRWDLRRRNAVFPRSFIPPIPFSLPMRMPHRASSAGHRDLRPREEKYTAASRPPRDRAR
jgi:hypothetical protein